MINFGWKCYNKKYELYMYVYDMVLNNDKYKFVELLYVVMKIK